MDWALALTRVFLILVISFWEMPKKKIKLSRYIFILIFNFIITYFYNVQIFPNIHICETNLKYL